MWFCHFCPGFRFVLYKMGSPWYISNKQGDHFEYSAFPNSRMTKELFGHNCCTFAAQLSRELGVDRLFGWIRAEMAGALGFYATGIIFPRLFSRPGEPLSGQGYTPKLSYMNYLATFHSSCLLFFNHSLREYCLFSPQKMQKILTLPTNPCNLTTKRMDIPYPV